MIALVTLSEEGASIAGILQGALAGAEVFVHEGVVTDVAGERFGSILKLTARIFHRAEALVFIAPTGVAVRSIAPHIADKKTDPAVVVVDVMARYAISLLGGHEAGANALSLRIANVLKAEPIISTTTEALKTIILGVGCRKGCTAEAIVDAIRKGVEEAGVEMAQVRFIASANIKESEAGLIDAASSLGISLRFISSAEIRACATSCEESALVREKFDLPGVAEPAALLAGRRTSLILPRKVYNGVVVAIARENSL